MVMAVLSLINWMDYTNCHKTVIYFRYILYHNKGTSEISKHG